MCPPYLQVSYPELLDLLAKSPLVHPGTRVVIEYPKSFAGSMTQSLGPLHQVRNRKYGRTYVAVYGPETDLQRGASDIAIAL